VIEAKLKAQFVSSVIVLGALACAVAGCGGDADPGVAAPAMPAQSTQAGAKSPPGDIDEATRSMVSGVAPGRAADALVDLKFELKSRPEIGKPVAIDIALLPKVTSDVMDVTYLANEGLTVQTSTLPSRYEHVQPGSVYRHQATVVPQNNGVFSLSAIVMVQTEAGDVTRTFSIPVVVGAPPDEASSAAP
jgi:hypothetical protein